MIIKAGKFVRFRFYLQVCAVLVFNGERGNIVGNISCVVVVQELVNKLSGDGIKSKYTQQRYRQYPV